MHRTASGGWHVLFRPHPDFRGNVTIADNVDTRGDGGYIIWWPAEGHAVVNGGTIAEVPDWIIEAMPTATDRHDHDHDGDRARPSEAATPLAAYLDNSATPEAAFAGILRRMAGAKPGERQALTFWCANRTCELIRQGRLRRDDALDALADVALSTGLAPRRVVEVMRRVEKTVLS